MTGKHELMVVLFFMPSIDPIRTAGANQSKGVVIYGKSKEGIQGTDIERGDQLRQKDCADAQDSGIVVSGVGLQYRGSGAGQVRG